MRRGHRIPAAWDHAWVHTARLTPQAHRVQTHLVGKNDQQVGGFGRHNKNNSQMKCGLWFALQQDTLHARNRRRVFFDFPFIHQDHLHWVPR